MTSISQMPHNGKWNLKKQRAIVMSARLAAAAAEEEDKNLMRRASLMEHCGERIRYTICEDCGHIHLASVWLCRDRLCPICGWRLAAKRYAEMMKIAEDPTLAEYNASVITLTVRNVHLGELRDCLRALNQAWKRFTNRKRWKRQMIGYARHVEITKSTIYGTLHPHLHILAIVPRGTMIDRGELATAWGECLDASYTPYVDIRRAYTIDIDGCKDWHNIAGAILESFKYSVKDEQLSALEPTDLNTFAAAIKGFQFITYGGIIGDLRRKYGITDTDRADGVDDTIIKCKDCGSTALVDEIYQWAFGSYALIE